MLQNEYSGDEAYTEACAPVSVEHGPQAELIAKELDFSSSNAGNNPCGMGGVDHTSDGCTIQRMLRAMADTCSSLHLIQEHKLGAYAYSSHAAFDGTLNG